MFQKRNPINASEGIQKMQNLINENFRYVPRWNSSGNPGYQKPTTFVKQDVVTNLGFLKQAAAQKSNFALNDLEPLTLIDTLDYYESRASKGKKARRKRKPAKQQQELKETKSSTAVEKTKSGKAGRPKEVSATKTIRKSILPKSKKDEIEQNKLRKELHFASSEGSLKISKVHRESVPTWRTIKKFQKNLELKGFNVIMDSRTKKQNPMINNNPAWQLLKERMKYM
ncbi:unnamed protein product [Phyllotreta striolata]|uniref:Uncharacterized protein n=1 Tax=Phyllotreta striolata TaxID=444603 RepID=A0A9N9XMU7_PHYSR|nr:unnamed protein product [Phyllotreta striolata]